MPDNATPSLAKRLVCALKIEGTLKEKRPVHAFGWGAKGEFLPSAVAKNYCRAFHFNLARRDDGSLVTYPVTLRFSNGSGEAKQRDSWSDVRGMAARFHDPQDDTRATDLIAMTLPEFFNATPEGFAAFAQAAKSAPCRAQTPWEKLRDMLHLIQPMPDPYPGQTRRPDEGAIRYADKDARAQLAVLQAATIGVPQSYLQASYHAVHTFRVTGFGGTNNVRFEWRPVDGVRPHDPDLTPEPGSPPVDPDDFLVPDLKNRLKNSAAGPHVRSRPMRFSLMMTIGETGDDFNDPSRPWPPRRKRVFMGMLTVNEACDTEKVSFNPGLLTDGVAASDDAILWTRIEAYRYSSEQRGGTPCPFAEGQ
ncbi:catalase [bacterium]|nr:catalase [bacterium]